MIIRIITIIIIRITSSVIIIGLKLIKRLMVLLLTIIMTMITMIHGQTNCER